MAALLILILSKFVGQHDAGAGENLFAAHMLESKLFENMFRGGVSLLNIGHETTQTQAEKGFINESFGRLGGQSAAPIGPRKIVAEMGFDFIL